MPRGSWRPGAAPDVRPASGPVEVPGFAQRVVHRVHVALAVERDHLVVVGGDRGHLTVEAGRQRQRFPRLADPRHLGVRLEPDPPAADDEVIATVERLRRRAQEDEWRQAPRRVGPVRRPQPVAAVPGACRPTSPGPRPCRRPATRNSAGGRAAKPPRARDAAATHTAHHTASGAARDPRSSPALAGGLASDARVGRDAKAGPRARRTKRRAPPDTSRSPPRRLQWTDSPEGGCSPNGSTRIGENRQPSAVEATFRTNEQSDRHASADPPSPPP